MAPCQGSICLPLHNEERLMRVCPSTTAVATQSSIMQEDAAVEGRKEMAIQIRERSGVSEGKFDEGTRHIAWKFSCSLLLFPSCNHK